MARMDEPTGARCALMAAEAAETLAGWELAKTVGACSASLNLWLLEAADGPVPARARRALDAARGRDLDGAAVSRLAGACAGSVRACEELAEMAEASGVAWEPPGGTVAALSREMARLSDAALSGDAEGARAVAEGLAEGCRRFAAAYGA